MLPGIHPQQAVLLPEPPDLLLGGHRSSASLVLGRAGCDHEVWLLSGLKAMHAKLALN